MIFFLFMFFFILFYFLKIGLVSSIKIDVSQFKKKKDGNQRTSQRNRLQTNRTIKRIHPFRLLYRHDDYMLLIWWFSIQLWTYYKYMFVLSLSIISINGKLRILLSIACVRWWFIIWWHAGLYIYNIYLNYMS